MADGRVGLSQQLQEDLRDLKSGMTLLITMLARDGRYLMQDRASETPLERTFAKVRRAGGDSRNPHASRLPRTLDNIANAHPAADKFDILRADMPADLQAPELNIESRLLKEELLLPWKHNEQGNAAMSVLQGMTAHREAFNTYLCQARDRIMEVFAELEHYAHAPSLKKIPASTRTQATADKTRAIAQKFNRERHGDVRQLLRTIQVPETPLVQSAAQMILWHVWVGLARHCRHARVDYEIDIRFRAANINVPPPDTPSPPSVVAPPGEVLPWHRAMAVNFHRGPTAPPVLPPVIADPTAARVRAVATEQACISKWEGERLEYISGWLLAKAEGQIRRNKRVAPPEHAAAEPATGAAVRHTALLGDLVLERGTLYVAQPRFVIWVKQVESFLRRVCNHRYVLSHREDMETDMERVVTAWPETRERFNNLCQQFAPQLEDADRSRVFSLIVQKFVKLRTAEFLAMLGLDVESRRCQALRTKLQKESARAHEQQGGAAPPNAAAAGGAVGG